MTQGGGLRDLVPVVLNRAISEVADQLLVRRWPRRCRQFRVPSPARVSRHRRRSLVRRSPRLQPQTIEVAQGTEFSSRVLNSLGEGGSVEWGRSNGRARREPAHRLDNGLEDSFRRLSSHYRGPTKVETRNALDAPLQNGALQSADALHAFVGAEECRDCVSIETDPAGDFSQDARTRYHARGRNTLERPLRRRRAACPRVVRATKRDARGTYSGCA